MMHLITRLCKILLKDNPKFGISMNNRSFSFASTNQFSKDVQYHKSPKFYTENTLHYKTNAKENEIRWENWNWGTALKVLFIFWV